MTSTYYKVKKILINLLSVEADRITPQSHLAKDLEADSLDQIEFVIMLEDTFGCKIPNKDLRKVQAKVEEAVGYIEAHKTPV
jgi:acyl carrier protein